MSSYTSAREYFDSISREITADQAKDLKGTFVFDIEGAGLWTIEFTEDGRVIDHGANEARQPDCTLMAKEKDWLDIVSGNTKPMSAFINGGLKVKGSTGKAMKLQQVIGQG